MPSEIQNGPLFFLIIAGIVNAALNLFLVIVLHLGVAGVAIATVIAQMISCLLVLRCLYRSDGSYQLRFSAMTIKWIYLKQIFQVGIPAGIQSTVINFSNVLLQSSVNSFGSIAMAGYTAANNIFGFLYAAANSITQACMRFYKPELRRGKMETNGQSSSELYSAVRCRFINLRRRFISLRTGTVKNLYFRSESHSMRNGNTFVYYRNLFYVRTDGPLSRRVARNGIFCNSDASFYHRNSRNEDCLDLHDLPSPQIIGLFCLSLIPHHGLSRSYCR